MLFATVLLAAIDAERATVYNLPSQNLVAMTSTHPDIQGVVYAEGDRAWLAVVGNAGNEPASSELILNKPLLGIPGVCGVARIDPATGEAHARGETTGRLETSVLDPWQIEGFKLTPKRE